MTATDSKALTIRSAMEVDATAAMKLAEVFSANAGGVFPKEMSAQQALVMARMSLGYGLDPFGGELILYQGNPYLTIKGALRKAGDHPMFDGIECRPATKAEREAFKCGESDHLWVAAVWRKDWKFPVVGYGRSGPGDSNPVSKTWPQEMAQKRAKHRALRDAFSLPLPGEEEASYERVTVERVEGGPVIEGEIADEVRLARPDQVTAIHTIVSALGVDEEDYRDELARYGVESSKELTEGKASAFIEMLSMRQRVDRATGEISEPESTAPDQGPSGESGDSGNRALPDSAQGSEGEGGDVGAAVVASETPSPDSPLMPPGASPAQRRQIKALCDALKESPPLEAWLDETSSHDADLTIEELQARLAPKVK